MKEIYSTCFFSFRDRTALADQPLKSTFGTAGVGRGMEITKINKQERNGF